MGKTPLGKQLDPGRADGLHPDHARPGLFPDGSQPL